MEQFTSSDLCGYKIVCRTNTTDNINIHMVNNVTFQSYSADIMPSDKFTTTQQFDIIKRAFEADENVSYTITCNTDNLTFVFTVITVIGDIDFTVILKHIEMDTSLLSKVAFKTELTDMKTDITQIIKRLLYLEERRMIHMGHGFWLPANITELEIAKLTLKYRVGDGAYVYVHTDSGFFTNGWDKTCAVKYSGQTTNGYHDFIGNGSPIQFIFSQLTVFTQLTTLTIHHNCMNYIKFIPKSVTHLTLHNISITVLPDIRSLSHLEELKLMGGTLVSAYGSIRDLLHVNSSCKVKTNISALKEKEPSITSLVEFI